MEPVRKHVPGENLNTINKDVVRPSDKTVEIVETVFANYAGFKKSEKLRRKIKRVIEGKTDSEIMAWINHIVSSKDENELRALAEDLTNHETFFFRDIIQLECLEQHVLPEIIKQKKKSNDRVIRIWSAACSTGEEAYSLAIITAKFMINNRMATMSATGRIQFKDGWDVKVYGTDISRQVIRMAQNGIYSEGGLSSFRSFPKEYYKYFDYIESKSSSVHVAANKTYKVNPSICDMTRFEAHNLNSRDLPMFLKNMDIVFCRNVMIYLDQNTQKNILQKFGRAMAKKAYLTLSVVDTMHEPKLFNEVRFGSNIIHQRR